ncbi:hypothetical protein SB4_15450 [Sphingomonas sanguinis]|uniref:Uncharacterized protein n=2 Tax=Sphingomonas sanguinis TaxID=33051 RepID=A0A147IN49_9SPHN|nr:hypothetical protein SB4_15450 [Sphingomonas sanguinis]
MRTCLIEPGSIAVTISGQVAVDADGAVRCPGDPEGQANIVFSQLIELLAHAGGRLTDLQSVMIILSDRAHFDQVNQVRNRIFATYAPASTLIIAELAEAGCLVEVNGFAIIDGTQIVEGR